MSKRFIASTAVNFALKNVADAVASGLISDVLIAKLNELEERKAILENQLMSLHTLPQEITVDTGLILSNYREISQTPASPDYKAFITLVEKVEVSHDKKCMVFFKNGVKVPTKII